MSAALRGLVPVLHQWRIAINAIRLAGWKWAQREICPLHPDLNGIVLAIRRLEDERRALVRAYAINVPQRSQP